MDAASVSFVVPVMNELDNVDPLYDRLCETMDSLPRRCEVVIVDDGSTDGTQAKLQAIAARDYRIKLVLLRRNYGQTAAMQAGIDHAEGEVIVTLDGDLQNDPADVPMMLEKIDEGYDLVHGWRKNRQDAFLNRKLPSRIANWLISRTTGFPIHDLGCTLKAIRSEIAKELELYGEMHRFIPILAHMRGARCIEVVTRHHPRRHGVTKYGIGRTFRVLLDLMTVRYLQKYFASPMKLFGMIGLACGGASVACGLVTVAMKMLGGVDMTGNPLILLAVAAFLSSIQFLSLGLLGEVSAQIYLSSESRRNYSVRTRVNLDRAATEPTLAARKAA